MRVALTGATGFVGGAIATRLVDSGHVVLALSRTEGRALPAGVQLVRGDLGDAGALATLTTDVELVIHAAGLVRSSDRVALEQVNVGGTVSLARAVGPGVPFVHISTAGIYGSPGVTVDESSGWLPLNDYERSKANAERRLRDLRPDAKVVRPTNVLGVGHPLDPLVRFMRRVARGRALGADAAAVNYVAVDAVAAAAVAAGTDLAAPAEVIVNEPMRLPEFVGLVARSLNVTPRFRPIPTWLAEAALGLVPSGERGQKVGRVRALVDPTWIGTLHRGWLGSHGAALGLDRTLTAMADNYRRRGLL